MARDTLSLEVLNEKVNKFYYGQYRQQVLRAVARARGETREFIERTHPQTAFGGKSLLTDEYNGRTNHQTILGSFSVSSQVIAGNIYSNYFQRWFNTGARQHTIKYGRYKGRQSTYYGPRGNYYEQNRSAIEKYFADALNRALDDIIKL